MVGTAARGPRARAASGRYRAELRLSIRVTAAAAATFWLADAFNLSQGYWAVITSIIVVQASVGGSLKATTDRLVGTIGGAGFGAVVALIAHYLGIGLLAVLILALGPLAFLAAIYPRFRIAPLTAVILLVVHPDEAAGPLLPALERVTEIGLGSIIGMLASLLVLPARAHLLTIEAAARLLNLQADLLPLLFAGLRGASDSAGLATLDGRIRTAMAQLETLAGEARQERASYLSEKADLEPLVRTVQRLQGDVMTIGQAVGQPFPAPIVERLVPPAEAVAQAIAAALREMGGALGTRTPPPAGDDLMAAVEAYNAAIDGVRQARLTSGLPAQVAGRIYSLGFALDQFCRDYRDMGNRAAELARPAADEAWAVKA